MKPDPKPADATTPAPAKPRADAPAARSRAPAPATRVRADEWRGSKRNASINEAIVAKFKILSARGKTLAQIADKLGITIGRARNISAEIRLGKK